MVKVKSTENCTIARYDFSYTFEKGKAQDVEEKDLNVLLETGFIQEVKK